jgi:hypothetical protein
VRKKSISILYCCRQKWSAQRLSINERFATEVANFLKFVTGREFEENAATIKDDWTRIVWDILLITKDKASKRKNAGYDTLPRQVTVKLDGSYLLFSILKIMLLYLAFTYT